MHGNWSKHAWLGRASALTLIAALASTGMLACDKAADDEAASAESEAPSASKAGDNEQSDQAKEGATRDEKSKPTLEAGESVEESGSAYFAVSNYGLVELDEEGEFSRIGEKLRMSTDMDTNGDGTAYIANVSGVYEAADGALEQIGDHRNVGNLKRLSVAPDGHVWGTSFQGIHRWDGESWTTTEKAALGNDIKLIKDIAAGPDGQVIAASSNKLHALDDGEWSVQDTTAIDAKPFFAEVEFGPNGSVFATGNHGLAVRQDGTWSVVDLQDRFARADFLSVGADGAAHVAKRTKDVWVASGSDVRSLSTDTDDVGASRIHEVTGDGQGRTWVATDNGIVVWESDGTTTHWKPGTIEHLRGKVEAIAITKAGPELPEVGPQEKGAVTGKVLEDGSPLAGVEVEACESPATMFRESPCADKPLRFSGQTNDRGIFKFDEVPVGSYGFAIRPSVDKKWRVTLAFDCCSKLEAGKTYDVGSFDLSR